MRVLVRIRQAWYCKEFDREPVVIGRASDADVPIAVQGISRKHAKLFRFNNRWAVGDLESTHGTKVNGEPIDARGTYVGDQDVIELGPAQLGVQLRVQSDLGKPLPAGCQVLTPAGEEGPTAAGQVLDTPVPSSDDEATQITDALPPPLGGAALFRSPSHADAIAAPPPAAGGSRVSQWGGAANQIAPPSMDRPEALPPARFVPGGTPDYPLAPLAPHTIELSSAEQTLTVVALGHHTVWVTSVRAIWKGSSEFQSLFWRDVLAVSADGGLLTFRLRQAAMAVELPVGEPHAATLLGVIQHARERFDAERAARESTAAG